MALSLMISVGWALATTLVSCLPMRQQHVPGVVRLNAVRTGLAASFSRFRHPLEHLGSRAKRPSE